MTMAVQKGGPGLALIETSTWRFASEDDEFRTYLRMIDGKPPQMRKPFAMQVGMTIVS